MDYTLLTGASSGIGFELAYEFAMNKHPLILVARSTGKLTELKTELENKYKIKVEVISLDLSRPNSADQLYKIVKEKNLKVDILVNNAGFGDHGLFADTDLSRNEDMIVLNILTLTKLTHLFLPDMLKSGRGRILNVASTAAFQPGPLMSVYYATKAYVLSFSEGLYEELQGTGVTVTALCPGPTTSGFQAVANIQDIKLLKILHIPTSKQVAQYGYKTLMSGKAVAVHGLMNYILTVGNSFMPRAIVRNAVMRLQQKRLPHS